MRSRAGRSAARSVMKESGRQWRRRASAMAVRHAINQPAPTRRARKAACREFRG
jgi:hypothetical protein